MLAPSLLLLLLMLLLLLLLLLLMLFLLLLPKLIEPDTLAREFVSDLSSTIPHHDVKYCVMCMCSSFIERKH